MTFDEAERALQFADLWRFEPVVTMTGETPTEGYFYASNNTNQPEMEAPANFMYPIANNINSGSTNASSIAFRPSP